MDKREEARLNMARSVSTLLARPQIVTAVAGTPAIGIAATELTDGIALIENLDTEANAAARGDGGSKTGLRQLALHTALIVDGKITAWAARRDLPEVINLFNHEHTDLARLGDEDFRTVVARILAKARELDTPPKQATEEGLTTGHVTTLESRLNAFRAVITRPEDLQKHESALRVLIDVEFAKIDRLLDLRLDKLLRELGETHAALYEDYRAARAIYESGSRPREATDNPGGGTPVPTPTPPSPTPPPPTSTPTPP